MEAVDLKGLPAQELTERIHKLREEIFKLRFKAVTEPVTDAAGLKRRRREIAVMRTVLRAQEIAAAKAAKAAATAAAGAGAGPGAAACGACTCSGARLGREGRLRAREAKAHWQENRAEQTRKRGPAKRLGSKAKAAVRAAKDPGRKKPAGKSTKKKA
jgi:large subunit ribosomal protein L29